MVPLSSIISSIVYARKQYKHISSCTRHNNNIILIKRAYKILLKKKYTNKTISLYEYTSRAHQKTIISLIYRSPALSY